MEGRKWVEVLSEQLLPIILSNEEEIWDKQSIYRVPGRIKDDSISSYEPQMVSIGPYHHGKFNLKPMEHHKRRALVRFLERSKRSIQEFAAALEVVADELMDSYEQLDEVWRKKEIFLPLMLIDGCFLIEILRGIGIPYYTPLDPIFSFHGTLNTLAFIARDILMVENQIPLLVLARLLSVEGNMSIREGEVAITSLVAKKFCPGIVENKELELRLHILDLYRRILIDDLWEPFTVKADSGQIVLSATELQEAGVVFRRNTTLSMNAIKFENGVLSIPTIVIDQTNETIYRNMTAFECLRAANSLDIRTYLKFMFGLANSAKDVALLRSEGLIESTLGSDEAIAEVIKGLAKGVIFDPHSRLCYVRDALNQYYMDNMNKWSRIIRDWLRKLKLNYFNNPWTFISVLAAAFLLGLTLAQTYFSVRSYYKTN